MNVDDIRLKTPDDIKRIRESGTILSGLFHLISGLSLGGMTTWELDSLADDYILKKKGRAAFKTVKNYGYASCISINNEAAHGVPSKRRKISHGDIVKIDIGIALNGYFSDACSTFMAGRVSDETQRLVNACSKSLEIAIDLCTPGSTTGDIGHAISRYAETTGFSIVKKFAGHGIGYALHESPRIPHYGNRGSGLRLPTGLVFAIEPVMNAGLPDVILSENKWTEITADGSLSAQFEHTIAVTEEGPLVLTA